LAVGKDLGLLDSGGLIPWVSVNASLTLATSTPLGRRYLDLVARYVDHFLKSGEMRWRLDQNALFGALHYMTRTGTGLTWAKIGDTARPFIGFGKVHDRAFVDHVAHGLRPDDAKVYQQLAAVMVVADRRSEAEVLLREALRLDPDSDQVKLALGRLLVDLDQLDEAGTILRATRENYVERPRVLKALRDIRLRNAFKDAQAIYATGTSAQADVKVGMPQSDLASQISARLREGTLNRAPSPHFVQDRIFPPQMYPAVAAAVSDFNGWIWGGNHEYPDRGDAGFDDFGTDLMRSVGRALSDPTVMDAAVFALGAVPLRRALADRGYRLVASARVTRDRTNYALGPHRDHHSRFGSILFYLPSDDSLMEAGTAFYVPKQADLKFDHGRHYPFSDFQIDRTIPFRPNSCLAFLNFGAAYHGVERIQTAAWRHVIQFTIYIRPDEAAAPLNG
jgi:tetratricopeptide (TPR) repeat protein